MTLQQRSLNLLGIGKQHGRQRPEKTATWMHICPIIQRLFSSGGMDKNRWREDKKRKNSRRDWMQGKEMDLSVAAAPEPDRYIIRFFLDYQAENYSEVLEKTMTLVRESGGLAIVKEKSRLATSSYKRENW